MKLYIYEHCPFCVRARMIFGLHQIPVEKIVLLNDDEDTPIRFIGAKQLPILQKDDGSYMGESLDIVRYINDLADEKQRLRDEVRPALQAWADKVSEYYTRLIQPRFVKLDLPEFATSESIAYFVNKKEKSIGKFDTLLNQTSKYLAQIHADLADLDALLLSEHSADGIAPSMEDIILFPMLRNLTLVRGIQFPPRVLNYVLHMAEQSDVDLYFDRAL